MRISKYSIYEFLLFHVFVFLYFVTFSHKDEWAPTVVLVVITLFLILLEFLRTKLLVTPLIIWYAFWVGVISVGRMDLGLYPFYQTWSRELLDVVLLNTVLFYWFYWIGELGNSYISSAAGSSVGEVRGDLAALAALGMMAVSLCAFAANAVFCGYIPLFTADANSARQSFILTPFYRIVNLLRFGFAVAPVGIRYARQKALKLALILFTGLMLLAEMLSGWRSFTLQAMVLFMTSLIMVMGTGGSGRKGSSKKLLPVLFACVAMAVVFIGYIAVTRDGVGGALREKLRYVLYTVDMYIAPNFLNFQSGMNNMAVLGYPIYTTEAFWGLFTSWAEMPQLPPIDQSIGAFNVSTYLLQPYVDLGVPGTALCSSIAGLAAGYVFRQCRYRRRISSLVLLGILNFAILVMHNNFFFRASSTVLWIIAGFVLNVFLYKRDDSGKAIFPDA